nr:M48 family metallopeptidase [Acanthopleuribacter pedis]
MPVHWEQHLTFSTPDHWEDAAPPEVQRIFDEMIAGDDSGRVYKLRIVPSDTPNAFALPDGTIGLTRGLLAQSETEQELAFVIGHEIGHLQARHNLKRMSRQVVYGLARTLLIGENDALAPFVHAEGMAHLHFSREQESEADRNGLHLVQLRYGHVGGADQFLIKAGGTLYPEWVTTHPHPEERTQALRDYAADQGWENGSTTPLAYQKKESDTYRHEASGSEASNIEPETFESAKQPTPY